MVHSRRWLGFILLVLSALVFAACATPQPLPAQPAAEQPPTEAPAAEEPAQEEPAEAAEPMEPMTLTWGMWGSPEEIATHQKVADAFMAEHPNITVELWSQPWGDYFTKLQTLWASGDAEAIPDVLFLSPVQPYAVDGVIEPLDSYIEAANYDLNDYWPGAIETTSFNGQVYGFPRDVAVEVLYYNKDHFDEAGLSYPDDTWTWDDLRAAAEALTVKESSGRVSRYGLAMEGGKHRAFLLSNGSGTLDDYFNPSESWYGKPESIETIEFIAGMMNDEIAMRDANLSQAGGDLAVFQSGQASMIIQNASRIPSFNAAGLNYDVAPVPFAPGGKYATAAGGAAWTMSTVSDNKDVAWMFIEFLQSLDGGQAIYPASGEAFPPLRSVAESDVWLGNENLPEGREAFLVMASGANPGTWGYFPDWNELNGTLMDPVMAEIWAGNADPAEVLPQLNADIDAYLAAKGYPK